MKELMKMKHLSEQIKQIALNLTVLSTFSAFTLAAQAQATVAAPAASAPSAAVEASAAPKAAASSVTAPMPMSAASAGAPGIRTTAPLFRSDTYGVEVTGAHLSASGYVVDVRYRVLNAAKAAPLLDKKVRPVIINETNGERFYVPQPPIIGSLRQTSRNNNVIVGKVYFMLFANPDKRLKPGDKVTMYVGDEKFGVLELSK
jgi:hypothetical protein